MANKKKVMILCTGNSCRSQMAEGFLRELSGAKVEAYSAGLLATELNPKAAAVMAEINIDITHHRSKEIDQKLLATMDIVLTVCDNAAESCPITPPKIKRIHIPIKDPTNFVGTESEIMTDFRRARDEIKEVIQKILTDLTAE
jgi:arsenate reductase